MSGGELVLYDRSNDKIKLLDSSLSVKDRLDVPGRRPHDVAAMDQKNVVVTIPDSKHLQFIQVLPSLKEGRTISMNKDCWGVAVAADQIFISCFIIRNSSANSVNQTSDVSRWVS